ncbi:MAG: hypothetical protein JKY51_04080, partial [Opitutaceae bacterium]|nr:hypothetical protein [Opitutaceae bacterium]
MKLGRFVKIVAILAWGFVCYFFGRYEGDDLAHERSSTKPEMFHLTMEDEEIGRSSVDRRGLGEIAEREAFSGGNELTDLLSRLNLLEDLPGKDLMLFQLLQGWGELNGPAAMNFALSLDPNKQGNAIRFVLKGWAKNNPEDAWMWVRADPDSKNIEKRGMYRAVLREMMNQGDFDLGIRLVSFIGEEEGETRTKERLTQQLMRSWLVEDGESALKWIDQMPDDPSSEGALKAFAENWAMLDGIEAAEWARSMEDQSGALTSAIISWTRNGKPAEVAEWLKGQSSSTEMDNAISIFVRATVREDPELAQGMIHSIQDHNTRDRAVLASARGQDGPVESLKWLDTHLSENRSEGV